MRRPQDLYEREMLIFVGKGGVGKTTTSSAVALSLAATGRRTLLVTVDPAKRLKDALGIEIGHNPKEVRPQLWAMMLDPEKVIEEYLRESQPDRNLTQHPMYRYITNYMPGINELIAIGKLLEFRKEKDFDTIVIDTAPTGHALSFLTTPMAVRDIFKENTLLKWAVRGYTLYRRVAKSGRLLVGLFGDKEKIPEAPDIDFEELFDKISRDVGEIHALLADHERTTLSIVTLPEKLPIEETVDLHRVITERLGIHVGYIIVNKMQPDALGDMTTAFDRLRTDEATKKALAEALKSRDYPPGLLARLLDASEFGEIRRAMNVDHLADLARRLADVPRILIPLHRKDVSGIPALEAFAEEFHAGLATPD
jgi:TRC40/GET3/ArsA family transport-energizing ATPase